MRIDENQDNMTTTADTPSVEETMPSDDGAATDGAASDSSEESSEESTEETPAA